MAPETPAVVRAAQAWLRSTWHIQVPFAWLEACVEWLQAEAAGGARLSQQQVNQQVLDQWLLTDLRDLDYPVLPGELAQAQKTELCGNFCVQVDSLLDVSQPAYGQLQKWRGSDCSNDEVSAVTQDTQKPWEVRPTRMLLMQITDGVQSLEAMEYQPIPALSTDLRPGVKLQLQGQMICRLGMLLLGPCNVKVLGGEVEDLVERNNRGRVLCRTLGLHEEEQQEQPHHGEEEAPLATQQVDDGVEDLELDDEELLASLEDEPRVQERSVQESGYGTVGEISTVSSSVRSVLSGASARTEASPRTYRPHSDLMNQDQNMAEDFADEDFDDLPLDELDVEILQQSQNVTTQSVSHRSTPQNPNVTDGTMEHQTAQFEQPARPGSHFSAIATTSTSSRAAPELSGDDDFIRNDETDFMDEDMDCFVDEANQLPLQQELKEDMSTTTIAHKQTSHTAESKMLITVDAAVPSLTSPPFTYLCLLEDHKSRPHPPNTEIRVKAFIVTLLGKLSSSNNAWSVSATISDGTGYMDVELSDRVLTGLLGFSVAEKASLKRDPARRGQLDAGMRRCQEGLVDMCCVMTIAMEQEGRKAVVTKAEQVSEKVLQELELRARDRNR